jgi:mono/diheme cytochrome c family protein
MHNHPSWPGKRQKLWALLVLVVLLGWAGYYELCQVLRGVPVEYVKTEPVPVEYAKMEPVEYAKKIEEEHFKYGSVGTDNMRRGIPYWIWKVLPDMFPDRYKEIGLNMESGKDLPIGFSKRRILGLDNVGVNCAFCHVSTLRPTAASKPEFILGMPGNTVNVEKFFRFLFDSAKDPRFETDNVMKEILKVNPDMGFVERTTYRYIVIRLAKYEIGRLREKFNFLYRPVRTEFGPGRVDTWVAYKVLRLQHTFGLLDLLPIPEFGPSSQDQDPGDVTGLADFPAIWPEKIEGMQLHWDGNNPVLQERNIIAAIGAGATPAALDVPRLTRVSQWIVQLSPPKYKDWVPEDIKRRFPDNPALRTKGKSVYLNNCAYCHDVNRKNTPFVEPIGSLGTDRSRLDDFTEALKNKLNTVGKGYPWRLHSFVKYKPDKEGYANLLLDGIWLRAPYLHNGSVPTLRHLLNKPCGQPKDAKYCRPLKFYRGNDMYDWDNVGFKADVAQDQGRSFFEYNTTLNGNHNTGHEYGTDLSEGEKDALIEYLKTL